jgi:hypothetical protein
MLKRELRRYVLFQTVIFLAFSLILTHPVNKAVAASSPVPVTAPADEKSEQAAKDMEAEYQADMVTQKAKAPAPQTTESDSGGNMLLIGGVAAAAAVGAVALAAGSGGSSSSDPVEPEEPKEDPVGADIDGDNWTGRLILVDSGYKEDVTATVEQNGREVIITTSTTQKYGRKFVGKIDSNAEMQVRDQDTGQDWTTFKGKARWNMIDLYDYVHNFEDLDRLYLTRTSKQ